jgi:hypothetical protein
MKRPAKRDPDPDEMSPEDLRELRRRIREANDPRRYLLASVFSTSFVLYYEVERDVYVMNDHNSATAFKSRRAAEAVLGTLSEHIVLIPAKRRKNGSLQVLAADLRKAALARRKRKPKNKSSTKKARSRV